MRFFFPYRPHGESNGHEPVVPATCQIQKFAVDRPGISTGHIYICQCYPMLVFGDDDFQPPSKHPVESNASRRAPRSKDVGAPVTQLSDHYGAQIRGLMGPLSCENPWEKAP